VPARAAPQVGGLHAADVAKRAHDFGFLKPNQWIVFLVVD